MSAHSTSHEELDRRLDRARKSNDPGAEIDALLAMGKVALDSHAEEALARFRLAEKVMRSAKRLDRLDEALGGQGQALRRQKELEKAIERYAAAERAAKKQGSQSARVRWILRRASALRAADRLDDAKAAVEEAELQLRPPSEDVSFSRDLGRVNFADIGDVGVLAELEGQIGLNLIAERNEQGAEDHYHSALYFAELAKDWRAVSTWATNLGNACARRRAYGQAIRSYEKAVKAAVEIGELNGVVNAAKALANCLSQAYRHEEGGDRLREIAGSMSDERSKFILLHEALLLYEVGICADKGLQTVTMIESIAADLSEQQSGKLSIRQDVLGQVRSLGQRMERWSNMPPARPDGPYALDLFFSEYMVRAERSGQVEPALQAAHLACDVRLGLAVAGGERWKRLATGDMLANPGLDLRVVLDTLRLLLVAERTDEAIDLLQRLKAPAYCVSTLLRLEGAGSAEGPLAAYLDAARALAQQVDALGGPAPPDFIRTTNRIRRTAERMREAGEELRELDPLLMARLGNPVRREELLDAMPFGGGVGIVDFVVGRDETLGVVLSRDMGGVTAKPFITPSFNISHARELAEIYQRSNLPKQLGGAHTDALMRIAKILHDNLLCGLARRVDADGINQLILIPDLFTRSLPLHLSFACGQEFRIPGVDTADANFLCEVMPIEYVPCLQAVAASQVYVRPRNLTRVAVFADPGGDLPGARASMEEYRDRSGNPSSLHLSFGDDVTKPAVAEALADADVVVFGTHGVFSHNVEETHLLLSGDRWTMADTLALPELEKRALLLLMACEAGAVAMTPNDRVAWGLPGALISAGASTVLANLWPVEDVTSTVLLERFLVHLGHRGFRPAAALFRAVRDLRRMERRDALEYCARHLERLEKNGAPPKVLVGAQRLLHWIEDEDVEHPFAHPFFWGATVIVGNGWHLPAGAVVGPPQITIENLMRFSEAESLAAQSRPRAALAVAEAVAARSDGGQRSRAYALMAWALLRSADPGTVVRARRKAARLLKHAERIAVNEDDEALREQVRKIQAQLETDHVDPKVD